MIVTLLRLRKISCQHPLASSGDVEQVILRMAELMTSNLPTPYIKVPSTSIECQIGGEMTTLPRRPLP